jgi:hypothetical protein
MIAAAIAQGVDPEWVGRLVRQAILEDIPYIFTHQETREIVDERYQKMCESFDWAKSFTDSEDEG